MMTADAEQTNLLPAALSLAMPGFGQLLQRRPLMAVAQLFLAGLVWAVGFGSLAGCALIPLAHVLSAISALNHRPSPA